MVTAVMNGPKHDDCSQVITVPPFVYIGLIAWRERIGVANVRKDSVPDYEGLARMSGRRVEAIFFCAGQGRQIMTRGLSSLHLRVRR